MRHGQRLSDGRLLVDNTILAAEARCQTAATIRHVCELAVRDEHVTLVSGQAIHHALEVFFKGGSAADALWAYETFYRPKWDAFTTHAETIEQLGGDHKMAADRRSYTNIRRVLAQWFETHPRDGLPFVVDPATVEASFEVALIPELAIWYTGTPDIGRVTLADGSVYFVDHKSTGRIDATWRRGFRTSGQMSGYLWGLQQATDQRYVGAFINAVEVAKVPSSDRKCAEHGVKYTECGVLHCQSELFPVQRTSEELERWRRNAVWLATRYDARLRDYERRGDTTTWLARVAQEGKLTGACPYCPNEEFCASGQSPLLREARYTVKVWDPADRYHEDEEGG